jgi:hypothetical protein
LAHDDNLKTDLAYYDLRRWNFDVL